MHLCSFLSECVIPIFSLAFSFCFERRCNNIAIAFCTHAICFFCLIPLHLFPLPLCFLTGTLPCVALQLKSGWSNRAPQNIHHPPLSLPLWIRDLPFSLPDSVPHSLSSLSFSLTLSPIALATESSTADAFSPTCPYLQKKARRETFSLSFSFLLWIWLSPHSALCCFLFLALCWLPSGFSYGIRMTTAAFPLPPAVLHHFFPKLFARG